MGFNQNSKFSCYVFHKFTIHIYISICTTVIQVLVVIWRNQNALYYTATSSQKPYSLILVVVCNSVHYELNHFTTHKRISSINENLPTKCDTKIRVQHDGWGKFVKKSICVSPSCSQTRRNCVAQQIKYLHINVTQTDAKLASTNW